MSNYTIAVNWSGKDSLSDSDPAKVISGSAFNTEFTTVQTAVNSKADINGSATESFSATTATAGTNTTQVATTAFVTTAIDNINTEAFPIGAVFISVVSTDPATLLGYGTWSSFAAGKMLIGVDSGDTDFDTVEETGGAKTHTLTEAEMPAHKHHTGYATNDTPRYGSETGLSSARIDNSAYEYFGTDGPYVSTTGSGDAHNNLPPYIVTYMWKRTA